MPVKNLVSFRIQIIIIRFYYFILEEMFKWKQ